MPQMNKGGKFIFGASVIRRDGLVRFPPQAAEEYRIASEGRVYLFTGSRSTGGFCVTRQGLLLPSKLGHILTELTELLRCEVPAGTFLRYKGRSYCWTAVSERGEIRLTEACWRSSGWSRGCICCPSAAAISPSPWARRAPFWRGPPASKERSRCSETGENRPQKERRPLRRAEKPGRGKGTRQKEETPCRRF